MDDGGLFWFLLGGPGLLVFGAALIGFVVGAVGLLIYTVNRAVGSGFDVLVRRLRSHRRAERFAEKTF